MHGSLGSGGSLVIIIDGVSGIPAAISHVLQSYTVVPKAKSTAYKMPEPSLNSQLSASAEAAAGVKEVKYVTPLITMADAVFFSPLPRKSIYQPRLLPTAISNDCLAAVVNVPPNGL